MLTERKLGFIHGVAAAALLCTGLDGALSHAFESIVTLPSGAFGDVLALVVVALWAGLVLALARQGLSESPALRTAAPAAKSRPKATRRPATERKRRSPASA